MCSKQQCPGANRFPDVSDTTPVCIPCDGIGYKAPFRQEPPFQMTFIVQWYMEKAEIQKRFLLSYFDYDGTIELRDLDKQKPFLRRMKLDSVKRGELFLGNKMLVLGRHMVILAYGDSETKAYCDPKCERAFLLVRPEAMEYLPCIIQRLEKCFRMLRGKIVRVPLDFAYEMSSEYVGKENYLASVRSLQDKDIAVFFVMAENALEKMKKLVGESNDPEEAMLSYHQSLRALYGKNTMFRGFLYTTDTESTLEFATRFFADCPNCVLPIRYVMNNETTCCVIKPHILREGRAGIVLADIVASGFSIKGLGIFWLNRRQAEEFYEVYKRIFAEAEFMAMVDELGIGPCMAVELGLSESLSQGLSCERLLETTVQRLRHCCGPADSDLARKLRPESLRARHGLNKIQNALHCTELCEDAYYEVEYFFKILENQSNGVRSATGTVCPEESCYRFPTYH